MRQATRVLTVVVVATACSITGVSAAATRQGIIDRSAEICAAGDRAMQPYDDRAERAARRGDRAAFLRNARESVRIGRRHLGRLADLRPPRRGRGHYRDFVDHTRTMANWLDAGLDAFAARRYSRAQRRFEAADRSSARAKAAARRYPLRRACIRYVNLG